MLTKTKTNDKFKSIKKFRNKKEKNKMELKHKIIIKEEYYSEENAVSYLIQSIENRLNYLIKQLENDENIIILNIYSNTDTKDHYLDDKLVLERIVEYIDIDEIEQSDYELVEMSDQYYLYDKDSRVLDLKDEEGEWR